MVHLGVLHTNFEDNRHSSLGLVDTILDAHKLTDVLTPLSVMHLPVAHHG